MTRRTGRCLCGRVSFSAEPASGILACHCTQCQRWTGGGPLLSVDVRDIEVDGRDATVSHFASAWGERVFCGTCGSTLWWKMKDRPISSVAAGTLDDQSGLSVTREIFVDYRPGWLAPFQGASQSTEADEMAKLQDYLAGEKS